MKSGFTRAAFFLLLLLLVACRGTDDPAGSPALSGRLLLWYPEVEVGVDAWPQVIARFHDLYPQVTVVAVPVAEDELRRRYETGAEMGLGPDLMLAPSEWVRDLAERALIRPLPANVLLDAYLSTSIIPLRVGDELYGLPLFLNHNALYYNTDLVEQPAGTLNQLLAHAENGHFVAMPTTFTEAFWGIHAFGGAVFDEEGRVVLDAGGMVNWLAWLKNAQDSAGMILHQDKTALRQLFLDEEVAYYIGSPSELPLIREALGADRVEVAPLPAGPEGAAGPLMAVQGLLFNTYSSDAQFALALELARFLANTEQSTTFMREASYVPANARVRVDARIHPAVAGFSVQGRSAVALPNLPQTEQLFTLGNDLYRSVLAGVAQPSEAVLAFTNTINEQFGFSAVEAEQRMCPQGDILTLWHTWSGEAAETLAGIVATFEQSCPGVTVELAEVPAGEVVARLLDSDEPPALLLAHSTVGRELAEQAAVTPLDTILSLELRQRFLPNALEALRFEQALYGLPLTLRLNTLYYNHELVSDPVSTIQELLIQAQAGRGVALPLTAIDTFWGMSAFSQPLIAEQGHFFPNVPGLVSWLEWLLSAQALPSVRLEMDHELLREAFITGEVAYYAGRADELPLLQQAMGADVVRNTLLPAGPAGEARPLLFVDALFVPATSPEAQADALLLATFLTNSTSQALMMAELNLAPANVNVPREELVSIETLERQAQDAPMLPAGFPLEEAVALVEEMYNAVLVEGQPAAEAACNFVLTLNEAAGVPVSAEVLGEPCLTGTGGPATGDTP